MVILYRCDPQQYSEVIRKMFGFIFNEVFCFNNFINNSSCYCLRQWMNGIIFGVEAPEITWNFFLRAGEIGLLKDRHPGLYRWGRVFLVLLWWCPSYYRLWYLLRIQTANLLWAQGCLGFPIAKTFGKLTPRTKWQGDLGKTDSVWMCGKHLKTGSKLFPTQMP